MSRRSLLSLLILTAGLLGAMPTNAVGQEKERWVQAKFNYTFNPVEMVVNRCLDRFIIDPTLEALGLKENQDALEQRLLAEIQKSSAALKSDQKEKLRELREEIRKCASRDELKKLATKFKNDLKEVNQRLDSAEEDLEWLKVKDEDRDNGTKLREDPKHFLSRAEKYLAYKDHFKALASARIASRLDGTLPEPYLLQGRVYAAKGAADLARACFDEAIKVAPKHAFSYRTRADARLSAFDTSGAAEDYGQAVRLDPKDGWSWAHRAQARIALNQFAAAIEDCSEALKLNRDDTFALFQRGRAYLLGGQPTRAVADFDEYVLALPKDPEGYSRRGFAYLKSGDSNKALKDLESSLKLDPNHAFTHNYLAQLWNERGEHTKAVAVGKRAVELSPQHWHPHFEFATALKNTSRNDEALKHFLEVVRLNTGNTEGYQGRACGECGVIYYLKGQNENAIAYLSSSLSMKPDSAYYFCLRASAHNRTSKYDKAIEDATAALKLSSDYSDAFSQRAYAHMQRQSYTNALTDYNESIRLNSRSAYDFNNRGYVHYKLGKNDKAVTDYTEALRLDPSHPTAHGNRGVSYRALGKYTDAANDFAEALKRPDWKEYAIENLIEISPYSAKLVEALPSGSNAYGAYSGLQKRVYVPSDEKEYGSYRNYGHSTTTSYAGVNNIPSGYWVYVAPYWYVWASKK